VIFPGFTLQVVIMCGACSNETRFRIVLGGIEAIANCPYGHWLKKHPFDASAQPVHLHATQINRFLAPPWGIQTCGSRVIAVYAPQCTEHIFSWTAWTTRESALLYNTMAPLVSVAWHASSRWQYIGLERSFSTIAICLDDDIFASSGNLFGHVRHVQHLRLAIHAVHICCAMRIVLHNLWSSAGVSHTQDTCWAVTDHILKQCCERVLFEQFSKSMPCTFVPNWTAFLPSMHVDVCQ
jgi:hypothetical protein